ncbi:SusC/RagA family TonB-linked outer membrane protein [Flavobacterium undicola]|uniref:SusC/RagA family TonB-linked outer membrane protein n=1 Tax=Flavobacterium undicola TaxID=1932779 RepID=UPI00137902B3|nr:SusC/RagA family TonB-linked outer membrane protein [Flavobacterium undicola]MBA0882634.1 SusC/RagA family TonB-linked outer membrane protein [Flavobacterium undicola]
MRTLIAFKLYCSMIIFLTPILFFGQKAVVKGTVVDEVTKATLPGVTVILKNNVSSTITDANGNYQINANNGDIAIFSSVGYGTIEKKITGNVLNISLREESKTLNEVVVIGYGSTKIKDATGSVTSVTAKDFNKGNIVTAENLLTGRVAGLSITTGGDPGAGSTIRIRGGASLGASNDPLIVINGMPVDNNSIGGSRSILSSINPNDIESFSVLKDASATAIYGSRASNGVIIITLKKGTKTFSASLDMSMSVNTLANKMDVFSGNELRELVSVQDPTLLPLLGTANTDWQKEIYRSSISSNTNVSVNGMLFDKIPSRASFGRTLQNGLMLTSEFERNTGSVTLNPSLFDNHLKISVNANASLEKNRFASGQQGNAITFDPTQPVYDANSVFGGYFQYYRDNHDGVINESDLTERAPLNPVAELMQRNSRSEVKRLYGNVKLDYNFHFLPELTAVLNLGMDKSTADGFTRVSNKNPLSQADGRIIGSHSEYSNEQSNYLLDGYFGYKKEFGKLNFEATAGYSYQKFTNERYNTNELLDNGVDSAPVLNIDPNLVLIGFFGRTNLSFYDKYLFTVSYRRDGTSRFSESNRWGNFPSAAFAWKVKEDLFPESKTLSNLKLRLGWGVTGQQDIGQANLDLYMSRYSTGLPTSQYIFGNTVTTIAIPQFRNEDLKWEETTTYNAGLDFGFFNDRVTATVEGFYKESKDLLANAAISDGSNFSNSGFQNIGNFTSKGLEFSVGADIIKNKNGLKWNVNFNSTFIKTEIKSLALGQDQLVGTTGAGAGGGTTAQIHRVGYTPFSFYVYKQIYDTNGKPIEGAYADLNGDNIINDADLYIHHNGMPTVTMGFASNINYKNIDLSFNMRASLGNYVYNGANATRAQYNLLRNSSVVSNLPTSVLETNFKSTEDVLLSDYYVENASFLKMDNVSLGYTFEDIFNSRSSIRLSASVQNVFTITNYSGLDPEVFSNGIDNSITPRPRTFLVGANVKF